MEETKHKMMMADVTLLLVAIIWGGGFVAGKASLSGFSAVTVIAFRFLGAALLSGILFFRIIRKSEKKVMQHGLLLGIIQFAQGIQLMGLNYTTAGKQAFLITAYVVLVPFVSWLIVRKRPNLTAVLAGIITMAGVALLSLNEKLTMGIGELLSLLSTVAFALQIVLIGLFAKEDHPIQLTFFQFISAGLLALVAAVIQHEPVTGAGGGAVAGVLYLIVANTVIGFIAQNAAQRYTKASHASLILSTESVFGFLASALIYGERFTLRNGFGCILILAAIIVSKMEELPGRTKDVEKAKKTA